MNARITFLSMLAIAGTAMTSCNDDDDKWSPEQQITSAFEARYPNASRVEWERERDYYVADFWLDNQEKEAWFTSDGQWLLTETDIPLADLPQAIQESFNASEYKDWRIEDVDKLERPDMDDIYVLDIELGEQDLDLYYLSDGTLLRASNDNGDGHHTPSTLPEAIRTHIENNYPGASILDYDIENGGYEVDILHDQKYKDVHFDASNNWTHTTWDIRDENEVEAQAREAIDEYMSTNNYIYIDDVDYYESPSAKYYIVEFEVGEREDRVKFALDGTILP